MEPASNEWTSKKPLSIHISRKEIFDMAAHQLSLHIKKEAILPIRQNDFAAIIEVTGLNAHGATEAEPIKFYGNFSSTAEEAINSAYDEALKFLVKKKLIIINDFNYAALRKTKSHLTESEAFLMFYEDNGSMLENELDFKIQGYKRLGSILERISKEASAILPMSITKYKVPGYAEEIDMVTFTGDTSSSDPANKVALSLIEMDQVIRVHGYEIKNGDHLAIKEYWKQAVQRDGN